MMLFSMPAVGENGLGRGGGDPALDACPSLVEAWQRQSKLLDPNPILRK
jgi:hypothetical protein